MHNEFHSITEAIEAPTDSISDAMTRTLRVSPDPRWIQTFTGRAFFPLAPQEQDVCIEDIAHALAMKCRYTGHVVSFYSVAQHSVLVSRIVPAADALWGLLHDASEAYLPDVARPVKKEMPGFRDIEDRLMDCIARALALPGGIPASVHHADLVMLATERRDLMSAPPYRWISTDDITPLAERIVPLGPTDAKRLWLDRFAELW